MPDIVCQFFHDLGVFDYRPASAVALDVNGTDAGRKLIDVDILGHIFEQSRRPIDRGDLQRARPPGWDGSRKSGIIRDDASSR